MKSVYNYTYVGLHHHCNWSEHQF